MANASGFSGKTLPLREDAILMNSFGICVSLHFAPQLARVTSVHAREIGVSVGRSRRRSRHIGLAVGSLGNARRRISQILRR